jgi:hypothetical protein
MLLIESFRIVDIRLMGIFATHKDTAFFLQKASDCGGTTPTRAEH